MIAQLPPVAPADAHPALHVALLGPPSVAWQGRPLVVDRRQSRALLYRVAAASDPVPRDQLCFLLWPDVPDSAARRNLSVVLTHVRRALPVLDVLLADPDGIALNPAAAGSDTWALATAAAAARQERGSAHVQAAIEQYRGAFLDGFSLPGCPEFDAWRDAERHAWERRYLDTLATLVDGELAIGNVTTAIAAAVRYLEVNPLTEEMQRRLMTLYAATGDRAAALTQFERCVVALERELGVDPLPETRAVYEAIRDGHTPVLDHRAATPAAAPLQLNLAPARLPAPATPLVGRVRERAALQALLHTAPTRLVTLTGTGGTGKSRLALALAHDVRAWYPDGVWFVPLAALSDVEQVSSEIARMLGLHLSTAEPRLEQLTAFLHPKHLLLILDNAEHLDGAAALFAALLAAVPALHLLVTSRRALQLAGEHEFRVPPLALPTPHARDDLEAVVASEAITLFTQRARAVDPTFAVTAANAQTVARICACVDGLPLGIELVAPRLRILDLTTLLERMERSLATVASAASDRLDRHRTLFATVDWSFRLLDATEQQVFVRLAIFVGGWDLKAIERIYAEQPPADGWVLERLAALAGSSMVEVSGTADTGRRFRLLEPLRQFAWDILARSAEFAQLRERHCAFYVDLAARAEQAAHRVGGAQWIERLDVEYGNLRAALRWAIDAQRINLALAAVAALGHYWIYRALYTEARPFTDAALALPAGTDPQLRTRALLETSYVEYQAADFAAARARAHEARHLAESMDDRTHMAWALLLLGKVAFVELDYATALTHFQHSHALRSELGDIRGLAECAYALGDMAGAAGEAEQARAWYAESESLARAAGDVLGQAWAQHMLAASLELAGDTATARRRYEDALTGIQQHGLRNLVAWLSLGVASVDLAEDDAASARRRAHEQLTLCRRHGLVWESVFCYKILGLAAFAERDYRTARAHFEQGMEIAEAHGLCDLRDQLMLCMAKLELDMGSMSDGATWLRDYLAGHAHAARHYPEDVAVFVEAVAWLVGRTATRSAQPTALRDVATLLGSAAARREHLQAHPYPFLRALNVAVLNVCRRHLDAVAMQAAWTHGQNLTEHEALAWASRVLEQGARDRPAERSVVGHHGWNEPDRMERA